MARTLEALLFVGGTSEPGGLHVHTADVAMAAAAVGHSVGILCPSVDYFSEMIQATRVGVRILPPRDAAETPLRYWRRHLAPYQGARVVLCRGKLGEGPLNDLPALSFAAHQIYTLEYRDADRPWSYPPGPRLTGMVMRASVHRTLVVSDAIASTCLHLLEAPRDRAAGAPCALTSSTSIAW